MIDKKEDRRYRSTQLQLNLARLQLWLYRPLTEGRPLSMLGRLSVGVQMAGLAMPIAAGAALLTLGEQGHALATPSNIAALAAFIIGWHFNPSTAAASFLLTPGSLLLALYDWLRLQPMKRAFYHRCERIGDTLQIRSPYRRQRVKVWLGAVVASSAFHNQPDYVRDKLLFRTAQAKMCQMELAEKIERVMAEQPNADPSTAIHLALQNCSWFSPDSSEPDLSWIVPTTD